MFKRLKRNLVVVFVWFEILILFILCIYNDYTIDAATGNTQQYTSFLELEDKRIGVTTGSIQIEQVQERFPDAKLYFFSSYVDMLEALKMDRIDAFAAADVVVRYMMIEAKELTYIDKILGNRTKCGAIFPKTEEGKKLRDKFSEFMLKIKQNGIYDEIQEIWYGEDESKRIVPDCYNLSGLNGILRIAVDTSLPPFVYVKDEKPVGIDIDTVVRFCKEYDYGLEFVITDFSGILPAVASGKCDFACSGIAFTPERAESVYFSEPTLEGGTVVAVLKSTAVSKDNNFLLQLQSSFTKTFLKENRWKLFLTGTANTLLITIASILFGTIIGFIICFICRKSNLIANKLTAIFVWVMNGTPTVVLLMLLYYVVFRKVGIEGLAVAIVCFSMTFGTSVYGILCSSINALDKGQTEGAYALGYTDNMTFFRIILPQAVLHFMPSYKWQVVSLLKSTAIVGYIAVQDLTKMSDIVRSCTYEAFFPLISITAIYFVIAKFMTLTIEEFIKRLNPKNRKPEKILKGIEIDDSNPTFRKSIRNVNTSL